MTDCKTISGLFLNLYSCLGQDSTPIPTLTGQYGIKRGKPLIIKPDRPKQGIYGRFARFSAQNENFQKNWPSSI
jgi:hypothetical protein